MLDTKADKTEVTAHTGRTDNPHGVTKAQVGLGSYPTSPADLGISTATQTALDGKVGKTGNEEIAGIKTFTNVIINKSTQDIDVAGYNHRGINRLNDVNNVTLFDDRITKESNKATGRKVSLGNKDASGTYITTQSVESLFEDGSYKKYRIASNGTWVQYRYLNADGTGYSNTPMRVEPGASDVVNTKYVLDRVDEIVGYIEDAIDAIELMPGPQGDKGDKGDPCTMGIELRDVYDIMRGINVGTFQSYQPSTEKTTWVVLQDTVPGYKKTVSMGPSDDPQEHTIKLYKTGDTLLTTKEFFVPKGWYVGFHIPSGPNEVSLIGQVHNFDVT